jgi:hypothetical protein
VVARDRRDHAVRRFVPIDRICPGAESGNIGPTPDATSAPRPTPHLPARCAAGTHPRQRRCASLPAASASARPSATDVNGGRRRRQKGWSVCSRRPPHTAGWCQSGCIPRGTVSAAPEDWSEWRASTRARARAGGEPSPSTDVVRANAVPVLMWQG